MCVRACAQNRCITDAAAASFNVPSKLSFPFVPSIFWRRRCWLKGVGFASAAATQEMRIEIHATSTAIGTVVALHVACLLNVLAGLLRLVDETTIFKLNILRHIMNETSWLDYCLFYANTFSASVAAIHINLQGRGGMWLINVGWMPSLSFLIEAAINESVCEESTK